MLINSLITSLQYFLAVLYSSHRERINRKQLQNILLNYRFLAPFLSQREIKIFTKKYCKDVDIRLTLPIKCHPNLHSYFQFSRLFSLLFSRLLRFTSLRARLLYAKMAATR